jgi:hypothetical protein
MIMIYDVTEKNDLARGKKSKVHQWGQGHCYSKFKISFRSLTLVSMEMFICNFVCK